MHQNYYLHHYIYINLCWGIRFLPND